MKHGDIVYSRLLFWVHTYGPAIERKYGVTSCWQAYPHTVRVQQAARDYRCLDCRERIAKGCLHGGTFYHHYCLGCVISEECHRWTTDERIAAAGGWRVRDGDVVIDARLVLDLDEAEIVRPSCEVL